MSCPAVDLLTPGSTYDAPDTLALKSTTFASSNNVSDRNTFKSEYVGETKDRNDLTSAYRVMSSPSTNVSVTDTCS